MYLKNIPVILLLVCCVFQCVLATGLLLNVLKKTVQDTRCKLHNIGSKIIQHDHHHGDPCTQPELNNHEHGVHGNNDFESSGHHRHNHFGGSGSDGNNHLGTSGFENNNFESQNGYQVTENLDGDRENGFENKHLQGEKQNNVTPNTQTSGNFGLVSTTSGYEPTDNISINEISKVSSENNLITPDIDVRSGLYQYSEAPNRTYLPVPAGNGRNIIKVSCPGGRIPTDEGECLEEFRK